jgi:hypothetical protein
VKGKEDEFPEKPSFGEISVGVLMGPDVGHRVGEKGDKLCSACNDRMFHGFLIV